MVNISSNVEDCKLITLNLKKSSSIQHQHLYHALELTDVKKWPSMTPLIPYLIFMTQVETEAL